MTSARISSFVCACIVASITGCSRYSVSINNNLVYEPPTLFSTEAIADSELATCISATITEQRLTRAEQLVRLMCPEGEIKQLDGIEVFTELTHLGLSNNSLKSLKPLAKLTELKQLDISGNKVRDFSPLQSLPQLNFVDSQHNDRADCATLDLPQESLSLNLPHHCKATTQER